MDNFARTRAMHQYYRDVFTRVIYLPEADVLPAHIVAEILNYENSDLAFLEETLVNAETDLEPAQEKALKLMMLSIAMANAALDRKNGGRQVNLPADIIATITNNVVNVLQLSDNPHYLVAAIQILYRVNEISSAMFLISNNLSDLSQTPAVLKILLLTCLMEEDYNQAHLMVQLLTAQPELIGEDAMTLVMVVCAIYKLGGYPDSFIDFRPLIDTSSRSDNSNYEWIISPNNEGKTTVLVACDKIYYYEHAIPLLLSIYESNHDSLNVHFHVYHCDSEIEDHLRRVCALLPDISVSLSTETFIAGKGIIVHYASRRFQFFSYSMDKFSGPILMLDADSLINKSWEEIKPHLDEKEIVVTHHQGLPFWEKVPANFIYTTGGTIARKYFDMVAHFIDVNLRADNAEWFLDQIALAAALEVLSPLEQMSIGYEENIALVDLYHSNEAFSWVVSTQKNAAGPYQNYKNQLKNKYLTHLC